MIKKCKDKISKKEIIKFMMINKKRIWQRVMHLPEKTEKQKP